MAVTSAHSPLTKANHMAKCNINVEGKSFLYCCGYIEIYVSQFAIMTCASQFTKLIIHYKASLSIVFLTGTIFFPLVHQAIILKHHGGR